MFESVIDCFGWHDGLWTGINAVEHGERRIVC